MYGQDQNNGELIVAEYKPDLDNLLRFLPYLIKQSGASKQNYYEGDGETKIIPVPVYDSTLLQFVREAEKTHFITKNYPYTYTRHKLKTPEDERNAMKNAKLMDIELFRGIISKYVLEGKRRGVVWTQAVNEEIFVVALECMDRLFAVYSNYKS